MAASASRFGWTPREREIVEAALEGRNRAEIADTLSISLSTVKTHIEALLRKTSMSSLADTMRAVPTQPRKGAECEAICRLAG